MRLTAPFRTVATATARRLPSAPASSPGTAVKRSRRAVLLGLGLPLYISLPSFARAAMSTTSGKHPPQPPDLPPRHPSMSRLLRVLTAEGTIKSEAVAEAMSRVDRAAFVHPAHAVIGEAYADHPLPIGYNQTISAPHMHATALELLQPVLRPGARVLDVGSGSGYLTACLALMVSPSGHVLGVELVPQLAAGSVEALRKAVPALMADGTIRIEAGNVLEGLLASEPPFDAIHVGAAADTLPRELVAALAPGGRMVVPVGRPGETQVLELVEKLPKEATGKHYVRVTRLMDVGSGYLTACLALMVSPSGHVLGVELVPQLAAGSLKALRKAVPALMADGTIRIEAGNVLEGLLASEPPFDAIHVGAAADTLPRELVAALAPGGRMVVPVGRQHGMQVLELVEKLPHGGEGKQDVRVTRLMGVGFVPLLARYGLDGGANVDGVKGRLGGKQA
ncbi:Protein-L-isoaspartate O-methyltransferase [Tetrabaena socialis]|uniref:protein-L-isoaspartate(D-aspartate) O-methyltransferase n=1 Tax=Tetrabaena socialis TaxID=47790 RepID=A0A2J7ZQ98_9CHLO|nr:Protein-L-isoaspartate O-methyltransferase [Tetrabaena socialis]|eukprot:PNH02444.1 Protein-L-isoaspartate O-methyltransferase [Tetrabaena socialis]